MKPLNATSIQYLKGVGPSRKKLFIKLGVETIEDLLYFFPRRYEDRRQMTPLKDVKIGEWQTVSGTVVRASGHQAWYTKKHVSDAVIDDGTARLTCVWFNQPYTAQYFKEGARVVLYGKAGLYKDRLQMVAPEYEIITEEDEGISTNCIVPIYPLTKGLTQRSLRRIVRAALDKYAHQVKDILPFTLREKYTLANLVKSLINIHFPESFDEQQKAFKRVSFEEFFLFQISVILRRLSITQKKGTAHRVSKRTFARFEDAFPFEFTGAQKRVIDEIAKDMQNETPMHRLLQGDVGSGKTLVALFGCIVAKENNHQAAFMAPTEILAKQHFDTARALLKQEAFKDIRACLLMSNTKKNERDKILRQIKEGEIDLVIGTHALIQEAIDFQNLSFVVVDEQHKFGVRQRALLPEKGTNPDVLIMTATPIPRTLCLTLYGDLDVSRLDEMPKARGKVQTVLYSEEEAPRAYEEVRLLLRADKQAYIVYPIIEESEKMDLKAAEVMFKDFKNSIFKEFRVGLIHGRQKRLDAQKTVDEFKRKKLDILVATTILEVGIDVPDANIMVIEHAERFGLAQLHQLRGRIGRSKRDATCFLIADARTPQGEARLKAVLATTDGFKIAEQDLLIRGPGEFFGRHQHGLNELRVADPVTQIDLLETARNEAIQLTETDPMLSRKEHREIRGTIEKRYPDYLALAKGG